MGMRVRGGEMGGVSILQRMFTCKKGLISCAQMKLCKQNAPKNQRVYLNTVNAILLHTISWARH